MKTLSYGLTSLHTKRICKCSFATSQHSALVPKVRVDQSKKLSKRLVRMSSVSSFESNEFKKMYHMWRYGFYLSFCCLYCSSRWQKIDNNSFVRHNSFTAQLIKLNHFVDKLTTAPQSAPTTTSHGDAVQCLDGICKSRAWLNPK